MIEEFATEKDQNGVDEFLMALGKFVIAFERVCECMRHVVMFSLRSQGLTNQGIEQVIIGGKTSAELQVLLGAIFRQLPNQDGEDQAKTTELLKEIKEVTEERNVLLHSSWQFGVEGENRLLSAIAIKFKPNQNSDSTFKVHGYAASDIHNLSLKLQSIQVRLDRLQICITQTGFKVSTELAKP